MRQKVDSPKVIITKYGGFCFVVFFGFFPLNSETERKRKYVEMGGRAEGDQDSEP